MFHHGRQKTDVVPEWMSHHDNISKMLPLSGFGQPFPHLFLGKSDLHLDKLFSALRSSFVKSAGTALGLKGLQHSELIIVPASLYCAWVMAASLKHITKVGKVLLWKGTGNNTCCCYSLTLTAYSFYEIKKMSLMKEKSSKKTAWLSCVCARTQQCFSFEVPL